MAFRPRSQDPRAEAARPAGASPASLSSSAGAGKPCGGLARALARAFREERPQILDIGSLCGDSVVYLARRGSKIHVEEVEAPPPVPERRPGEPAPEIPPFRLDQPDGLFHLVLAWEVVDFVPPGRLAEFGSELRRVLRDGGVVFLFSHARPESPRERPPRYLLVADDLIVRQESSRGPIPRYVHPTRDLERALAGFDIRGIQLQRNQMREISAVKVGMG